MFRQRRTCWSALAAVFVATTAAPALADTGFYVGATAGESRFEANQSDANAAVTEAAGADGLVVTKWPYSPYGSISSSADKTGFTFGGLVGYRFTPEFAIEAAYIDLGKLRYKSSEPVMSVIGPYGATSDIGVKAKGPTLAALGILPLSRAWEIYGRAGLFFSKMTLDADTELDFSLSLPYLGIGGGPYSVSANSVDPLVGIGTAWHVAHHVALRAEYTRYINVGDKAKTGEMSVDLFNIGVTYSFR